jgi:hypothetical protein
MNYEPGRVVVFHKRSRGGFRPGEQWKVSGRDHDGTVVTLYEIGRLASVALRGSLFF